MQRKGVCYDVGTVFSGYGWRYNTRPRFDRAVVNQELEIIQRDLHCNAVRIVGRDIDRVTQAAGLALRQGLEVWFSPWVFDKSPRETFAYFQQAAGMAAGLYRGWPDRVVFVMGGELTLFMQGIVPGRSVSGRMARPSFWPTVRAGKHNARLNAFLRRTSTLVRRIYAGPLTYASLTFENVDWSLFDYVGVDHYRDSRIKDRYVELLQPSFAHGKPVAVTEFGMRAYRGAESSGTLGFGVLDSRSFFLHTLPMIGRFVRPRLNGAYVRDEAMQAREIGETLGILDGAGVDGAFVGTFVDPGSPFSADATYDLDMSALSLVKSYAGGRHGTTYPDMPWEPKQAFRTVADFYAGV